MSNLTSTDRKILIIAALIMALFSYFMYDDSLLFPRRDNAGLKKIGSFYSSSNDVRVKSATNFSWFPASTSDSLHLQDAIFTGEHSQADLTLDNGTKLHLKENSLVSLNIHDGEMNLDLKYGNVSSQLNGKMKVNSGGKTFDLDGKGAVELVRSSNGEINVAVKEGTAKIGGKVIHAGEQINLTRGTAPKAIVQPTIELLTADQAQFVAAKSDDSLDLRWKSKGPITNFYYQVCSTADCQQRLKAGQSPNLSAKVTGPFTEGTYYWMVKGFDKTGKEVAKSAVRSFQMSVIAPPQITTSPQWASVNNQVRVLKANEVVQANTQLSWESDPRLPQFEYQIAKAADFKNIVHDAVVDQKTVATPKFENGEYFYRVRGKLAAGKTTDWSTPAQFKLQIQKQLAEKPKAPILSEKLYSFNADEAKKRGPAAVEAPTVSWSKIANAKKYQVQFSKDSAFQNPMSYEVTGHNLKWTDYKPGPWKVRVFAVDADGLQSPPSDPSKVEILLNSPLLQAFSPVIRLQEKDQVAAPAVSVPAQWKGSEQAHGYLIQVASTEDFSAPQTVLSSKNSLPLSLSKPGAYYVRVQTVDKQGRPTTGFSNVEKINYEFLKRLDPPALREPFKQASLFLQSVTQPLIWFEWNGLADASAYDLEIAMDPEFQKVILSKEIPNTRYLLREKIAPGSLFWRVRAKASTRGISPWSEPREMIISTKKNEVFSE